MRGQANPSVSPANVALYNPSYQPRTSALTLFNPASQRSQVVWNSGVWPWACPSPAGTKIVAGSDGGFPMGLHVMNTDGSGVTQLTTSVSGGADHQPSWSDSVIVFVRVPPGAGMEQGDIYRLSPYHE